MYFILNVSNKVMYQANSKMFNMLFTMEAGLCNVTLSFENLSNSFKRKTLGRLYERTVRSNYRRMVRYYLMNFI